MKISVNTPSYRRPYVKTFEYIPFTKVWVDPGEYDAYIAANKGHEQNIVKCAEGIQGNLPRVRNHIMDTEFAAGADAVVMIDDDVSHIGYFESEGRFGYRETKVDADDFLPFVEEYTVMAMDLGAYLWGVNLNYDKTAYNHYCPFSTCSVVLAPFCVHIKGGGIRYDERFPIKDDYDFALQHLNKWRCVLRVNKYHYYAKLAEQRGGTATVRNMQTEEEQLALLRKKWGSDIIGFDKRESRTKKADAIDFHPIVRVPIKGV